MAQVSYGAEPSAYIEFPTHTGSFMTVGSDIRTFSNAMLLTGVKTFFTPGTTIPSGVTISLETWDGVNWNPVGPSWGAGSPFLKTGLSILISPNVPHRALMTFSKNNVPAGAKFGVDSFTGEIASWFLYEDNPQGTATITSPSGTVSNLEPSISVTYSNPYDTFDEGKLSLLTGAGALIANTDWGAYGNGTYSFDIFNTEPLNPGTNYQIKYEVYSWNGIYTTTTKSFSTSASVSTINITGPPSGQFDITPDLTATVSNNYGFSITATEWQMWLGTGAAKIGQSASGVNSGINGSSFQYAPGANWSQYTSLQYGNTYQVRLRVLAGGTWSTFATRTFTIASISVSTSILKPDSGLFDLTPDLQAVFTLNNPDDSIDQTEWQMWDGAVQIGQTAPGVNAGISPSTLTYDFGGNWLTYTPLQYGKTYTVKMRAKTSTGYWSPYASRSFSIAAYAPVATITAPTTKIDTLNPVISGTYTSSLGFSKQAHIFQVYDSNGNLIGSKLVTADSTSPFSTTYQLDGTWDTYTALNWQNQYYFLVRVQDTEDIWSDASFPPPSGAVYAKLIRTNSYPSPPTNMLPMNGATVTTRQPQLSATFQDPDNGDTPLLMEVEVVGVTNPAYSVNRIESDADEVFQMLLSDSLVIGHTYSWRTRFTDQGGLQGAWSSWSTFTVAEGVETYFTNPTQNVTLTSPIQTFTWTYSHPSGVAQASGRLRIYNQTGSVPIYDSGTIAGTYQSQVLSTTLFQNNKTYRALATVTDANGDSATTGYVYFNTLWVGPDQPLNISVDNQSDEGRVRITWLPVSIPNFKRYRIYRKDTTEAYPQFILVDEVQDMSIGQYDYYFAASGKHYEYAVTVVEDSTGAELESTIEDSAGTTLLFPSHTWLNEQYDPVNIRVQLMFNPTRTEKYSRSSAYATTIGRSRPVLHIGRAYSEQLELTFMLRLPFEEIDILKQMIARGEPVLYRDGRGRRMWVGVVDYTLQDMLPNRGVLTLSLTAISTVDR